MEIQVGEYIRTEIGTIGKVKSITYAGSGSRYYGEELERNYYTIDYNEGNSYGRFDDDGIIKHSKNIIDLIEVGDYVNGSEVLDVMENLETGKVHLEMTANYTNEELGDCTIYNKDIKSIVTKEMFNQVKYEVN